MPEYCVLPLTFIFILLAFAVVIGVCCLILVSKVLDILHDKEKKEETPVTKEETIDEKSNLDYLSEYTIPMDSTYEAKMVDRVSPMCSIINASFVSADKQFVGVTVDDHCIKLGRTRLSKNSDPISQSLREWEGLGKKGVRYTITFNVLADPGNAFLVWGDTREDAYLTFFEEANYYLNNYM